MIKSSNKNFKNPELSYEEIKQYLLNNGYKIKSPHDNHKYLYLLKYNDPLIIGTFDINNENKIIIKDLKKSCLTGLLYNEFTETIQINSKDNNGYHCIDMNHDKFIICGYHCHIFKSDKDAKLFLNNYAKKYSTDIKNIIKTKEKTINDKIKENRNKISLLEKTQNHNYEQIHNLDVLKERLDGKDFLLNAKTNDIFITRCGIKVEVDYIKDKGVVVTCITNNEKYPDVVKYDYGYFCPFSGKITKNKNNDFDIIKRETIL